MQKINLFIVLLLAAVVSLLPDASVRPAQAMASARCTSSKLPRIAVGFTLTHIKIDSAREEHCSEDPGANIQPQDNIVLNYDRPKVRERARAILDRMAGDGAKATRAILWYRLAEDVAMARAAARHDRLGYAVATRGRLPRQYMDNLIAYAADIVQAGYTRLYINIAPMGTSNPKTSARTCRADLPDCFDPNFLSLVWSVDEQVIGRLRSTFANRIDLVFDIASESCFLPNMPSELERNLAAFTQYMVSQYAHTFGSGGFVVSCIGVHPARALPDLRALAELYHELDIKPAAIDIHLYATKPDAARKILLAGSRTAAKLGVPLDISEMPTNDLMLARVIDNIASSGEAPNLRTILLFPHTADNACHINTAPPYKISDLQASLGCRIRQR